MMAAVAASGAYEGRAEFTGPEAASKGKLVSNCRTLRTLGWSPKHGASGAAQRPGHALCCHCWQHF